MKRGNLRDRIAGLDLARLSAEAIAEAICSPMRRHHVTGFYRADFDRKASEVRRAQRHVVETPDHTAFLVSADVVNDEDLRLVRAGPAHVSALAAILVAGLEEPGAAVVPMYIADANEMVA